MPSEGVSVKKETQDGEEKLTRMEREYLVLDYSKGRPNVKG
jgi:hypothetical protein